MKQGGVACKARGIIPFYFAFSLPSVGKPTPPLVRGGVLVHLCAQKYTKELYHKPVGANRCVRPITPTEVIS